MRMRPATLLPPRRNGGVMEPEVVKPFAFIGIVLAFVCAFVMPVEAADEFPNRPIRMIVPYAAGGGTDIVARIVAQKLQEKWGSAVIVENRGGAGGNLGAEEGL